MKKSFVRRYVWNVYTGILYTVAVIILIFFFRSRSGGPHIETATAARGTVVEHVSVTGKVSPVDKADLAFQKSGVLAQLYVSVGDSVVSGDPLASLQSDSDKANLIQAQAKLDDISRALRPEELAVEQSKVFSSQVSLNNAKADALDAARDAYVKAQQAVTNYADTLFSNPQSANPTITVNTASYAVQNNINFERVGVTDILTRWKADLAQATSSAQAEWVINRSQSYIATIKTFLSDLSTIVAYLTPGNSGLSQVILTQYVSALNSGLSSLNMAISSLTGAATTERDALAAVAQANDNYNLKLAGSSNDSVRAQAAAVTLAKAELAKDTLRAPIDGKVTRIDPAVGEFVTAGATALALISDGNYKIEAYVPEADIAKISLDNSASTTLDAYGQYVDFPAHVTAIDPAETVIEGVPTYKVTLHFMAPDERIRSGMTANLEIITRHREGVLIVPSRAVIDTGNGKAVKIVMADGKTTSIVPVTVGLKGSDGYIEITSGLAEGDKVVTYMK